MSKDLTRRAGEASHAPSRMFGGGTFFSAQGPLVQRMCAECADKQHDDGEVQAKLSIGAPGDVHEREAEQVADRVMSGGTAAPWAPAISRIQRVPAGSGRARGHPESQARIDARRSAGRPLPPVTRRFFEPRLGSDLGNVRVHSDPEAQVMAKSIDSKAFTYGSDIYFGAGQYRPETPAGQHLLAHELTHTVQQGATKQVQRALLEIVPADLTTVPTETQRQAAASCDIDCGGVDIGTLHAMPLTFHTSRGTASTSASGANGVGAALHFLRNSTAIPAGNACRNCTDFKMIQVLHTNAPAAGRGGNRYVDNGGTSTPFYDDVFATGTGRHTIPTGLGFGDEGHEIRSTRSIYDTPFRTTSRLSAASGSNFFWRAETHVVCVKSGKDRILGGVTYGFTRTWNSATSSHGDVVAEGPACQATVTANFTNTLTSDPTTSSYQFET